MLLINRLDTKRTGMIRTTSDLLPFNVIQHTSGITSIGLKNLVPNPIL